MFDKTGAVLIEIPFVGSLMQKLEYKVPKLFCGNCRKRWRKMIMIAAAGSVLFFISLQLKLVVKKISHRIKSSLEASPKKCT